MDAVTIYGVLALCFMLGMYALERRGPIFVVGFAMGCLLSSAYGFLSGAWPFGVVEIVWCGIALWRLRGRTQAAAASPSPPPTPPSSPVPPSSAVPPES